MSVNDVLTAEAFAALPREGLRLELIRGELSAMPLAFAAHGKASMRFGSFLARFVITYGLGEVYAAETGFLVARGPDTVRAPDAAFIQASRVPPEASDEGWVRVMPDAVVEVVSSGDRATAIADKVHMWLDAGVRLVRVAYPRRRAVEVHRPGQPVLTLGVGDQLDGYDVVPGFSAPVAQIFP